MNLRSESCGVRYMVKSILEICLRNQKRGFVSERTISWWSVQKDYGRSKVVALEPLCMSSKVRV